MALKAPQTITHLLKSFLTKVSFVFKIKTVTHTNNFTGFFFPELAIPPNANVYYAVSTQYDLNFILREKKDDLDVSLQDASSGGGAGDGSMLTPKSGLRKGSRDASKARRKLLGLHL